MTTSTEADSDTTPGTDLDGGVATDQPGTNSTPGADAGGGTGSMAVNEFLGFQLCQSPY